MSADPVAILRELVTFRTDLERHEPLADHLSGGSSEPTRWRWIRSRRSRGTAASRRSAPQTRGDALVRRERAARWPPIDLGFWTEAALLVAHGVDAVVFGPGGIAQAHGPDEWVALDELRRARTIFSDMFARRQ